MVEPAVDGESLAEAARASGQFEPLLSLAVCLHEVDAVDRLDCADEHRGARAVRPGHDVGAVTRMDRVHIGPARRAEYGVVALGFPARGVAGRVAFGQVGLGLDDAPGEPPPIQCSHKQFANQVTGNRWGRTAIKIVHENLRRQGCHSPPNHSRLILGQGQGRVKQTPVCRCRKTGK